MGFAHYLSQENPQTCDLCTSKNKTVLKKKKNLSNPTLLLNWPE